MRILWILWVLVLATMAKEQCHGCHKKFTRLNNHLTHCDQVLRLLEGGLKRRMDEDAERRATKRAKEARFAAEEEARQQESARRAAEAAARMQVSYKYNKRSPQV